MNGQLIELLDRLDEVDDTDRFNSKCIFAEGGPSALPFARAMICENISDTLVCPKDSALEYVLEVQLAKDCIRVWSEWRNQRIPNSEEKFDAIMHYSLHDSWLPLQ